MAPLLLKAGDILSLTVLLLQEQEQSQQPNFKTTNFIAWFLRAFNSLRS